MKAIDAVLIDPGFPPSASGNTFFVGTGIPTQTWRVSFDEENFTGDVIICLEELPLGPIKDYLLIVADKVMKQYGKDGFPHSTTNLRAAAKFPF